MDDAARQANRDPAGVTLIGASKPQKIASLNEAYALGLRDFGENYLQEALPKQDAMPADCRWHFIGPIQSNKTAAIATRFDWVHSVDRLRIARRLSAQRPVELPPLNICLQVNVSDEPSKSGLAPDELGAVYDSVRKLPGLRLRGLMAIPAASDDRAIQFAACDALRQLRDALDPSLDTLSMGMSADLEAAILAGATMVRIGSSLFGPRPTNLDP